MDRGTYASASAGLMQLRKLDVVSNNLANASTPGFKRQMIVGEVQSFDQTLAKMVEGQDPLARPDHERSPGVVHVRTMTDFSPGPIKNTGNAFDVALRNPNDFLVIGTPDGERYTRAGNLTVNGNGELVALDGFQVLSDGGAINVNGPNVKISANGEVSVNRNPVGRLRVVRFEDPSVLEREGAARFRLPAGADGPATVNPDLVPEALEMANTTAVASTIDLIAASRGFSAYTKMARAIDELNQTTINQIGRRR